MKKLSNLSSIVVNYGFKRHMYSKNVKAISVDISFEDADSARLFRDLLGSEILPIDDMNFIRVGQKSSLTVRLGLDTDLIAKGMRADCILNYLASKFEFPREFSVVYPTSTEYRIRYWTYTQTAPLPFTLSSWVKENLVQFRDLLMIRQSMIEKQLSSLVNAPVLVSPFQSMGKATGLKITCDDSDTLKLLKKKLYHLALQNDVDDLYHFDRSFDTNENPCVNESVLKVNSGVDFQLLLDQFAKITLADAVKDTQPLISSLVRMSKFSPPTVRASSSSFEAKVGYQYMRFCEQLDEIQGSESIALNS